MRLKKKQGSTRVRPVVCIAADGLSSYGRAVMRGAMRYANAQHQWLIERQLNRVNTSWTDWPESDGAIVAGVPPEVLAQIVKRSPHVVHCSGAGDPAVTPVVCLDDAAAGKMAAEHLLDCRLENFGFYGRSWSLVSINRGKGYVEALRERGFMCSDSPVDWPADSDRWNRDHWPALIAWLRGLPKPVGIMSPDDFAAEDLAAACLKADIPVPDRVAIIGVNNDDLLCDSAWPPLSSVEADFSRIGYAAAGLLDRMMRGEKLKASERMVRFPPLGVVRRLSTDVLAVDDANLADAVRFIREHACDPCTVHDVLRQVPVARRWLERQFVQKLGRTPHDEIMHVRMESAKRLLLRPELTLPDIAERCGFSAANNFSRAFVQTQGETPAAWRRTAMHRAG